MAIIKPHSHRSTLRPVSIFCSYAHSDEAFRAQLDKHLSVMRRNGEIVVWYDRDIGAGTNWKRSIDEHLNTAEIILLLVSADFFKSGFCCEVEMMRALERYEQGKARLIPILLRDCDWQATPVANLQVVPFGAKPIANWEHPDEAYNSIVSEIRKVVSEIRTGPTVAPTARARLTKPILLAIACLLAALFGVLGAYQAGMFGPRDTKVGPPPETSVLYGSVVDDNNKELPGVTIRLADFPNLPTIESSAPYGRFVIQAVPKKRDEWIRIEASKEGYVTSNEPYVVGPIPLQIMLEKKR